VRRAVGAASGARAVVWGAGPEFVFVVYFLLLPLKVWRGWCRHFLVCLCVRALESRHTGRGHLLCAGWAPLRERRPPSPRARRPRGRGPHNTLMHPHFTCYAFNHACPWSKCVKYNARSSPSRRPAGLSAVVRGPPLAPGSRRLLSIRIGEPGWTLNNMQRTVLPHKAAFCQPQPRRYVCRVGATWPSLA
jgi:hypothetical protein